MEHWGIGLQNFNRGARRAERKRNWERSWVAGFMAVAAIAFVIGGIGIYNLQRQATAQQETIQVLHGRLGADG